MSNENMDYFKDITFYKNDLEQIIDRQLTNEEFDEVMNVLEESIKDSLNDVISSCWEYISHVLVTSKELNQIEMELK